MVYDAQLNPQWFNGFTENEEVDNGFFHCEVTEFAIKGRDTVNVMQIRSCWESIMINELKKMLDFRRHVQFPYPREVEIARVRIDGGEDSVIAGLHNKVFGVCQSPFDFICR